jgi:hypothetical protein
MSVTYTATLPVSDHTVAQRNLSSQIDTVCACVVGWLIQASSAAGAREAGG